MSRWDDLEKNHVTVSDRVSIAEYGRRLEVERELLLRVAEAAEEFMDRMIDMYTAGVSMKVYQLDDALSAWQKHNEGNL